MLTLPLQRSTFNIQHPTFTLSVRPAKPKLPRNKSDYIALQVYLLFQTVFSSLSNMGMIIGLLIPIGNMYEMASRHTSEPLTDLLSPRQQTIAFTICLDIAKKAGVRWVPVDYPKGSKRACIVMPLYERDDGAPLRMEQWAASRGVAKARQWLKDQGIAAAALLPFVAVEDPIYWVWLGYVIGLYIPISHTRSCSAYRAYPYDRLLLLPSQSPGSRPSALTFAPNIQFLGLLPAPNSLQAIAGTRCTKFRVPQPSYRPGAARQGRRVKPQLWPFAAYL
ncbi:hypothetical protein LshimejAT787_0606130 [Lyophyllum shimeji]|uniref:Uncharacterized protein n=1 Tax=Lyophyllum shimeji TaxID=47721 RepID=A0A9P3PQC3_LYOSH|nr:hypothetical protein LshimejAT787_0606130 [Lyophyllum shimeji]